MSKPNKSKLNSTPRKVINNSTNLPQHLPFHKQQNPILKFSPQQYIQLNYLKDSIFKINPNQQENKQQSQKYQQSLILTKQQQNLKEYLYDVNNDEEKIDNYNQNIKSKFFNIRIKKQNNINNNNKNHSMIDSSSKVHKNVHQFNPYAYLQFLNQKSKKKINNNTNTNNNNTNINNTNSNNTNSNNNNTNNTNRNNYNNTNFNQHIASIKYLNHPNHTNNSTHQQQQSHNLNNSNIYPNNTSKSSRVSLSDKQLAHQSIQNLLSKSLHFNSNQLQSKRNYRSHNQITKINQKIIQTQRNNIMYIIKKQQQLQRCRMNKSSYNPSHNMSPMQQLQLLPNKQKYSLDFTSYCQIKNKKMLDKYIYQKHLQRPTKQLEKFQNFILKQVKFSSEHKNKIQKFFINMRDDFRKIQKYSENKKNKFKNISATTQLITN